MISHPAKHVPKFWSPTFLLLEPSFWSILMGSDSQLVWGLRPLAQVPLGSMRMYRRWLQRFRQMSSTMEGLRGVLFFADLKFSERPDRVIQMFFSCFFVPSCSCSCSCSCSSCCCCCCCCYYYYYCRCLQHISCTFHVILPWVTFSTIWDPGGCLTGVTGSLSRRRLFEASRLDDGQPLPLDPTGAWNPGGAGLGQGPAVLVWDRCEIIDSEKHLDLYKSDSWKTARNQASFHYELTCHVST